MVPYSARGDALTSWSSAMSHDTEAESRTAKAYRVVVSFCTRLGMAAEEATDWKANAPKWFLMWGLIVAVAWGSFASGLAFNLLMLREREIKEAQLAPALQGIADLRSQMNSLEIDVAALKAQAHKVDKIDANVERLLRRGGR